MGRISRRDAVKQGMEYYTDANRCPEGHLGKRFVLGNMKNGKRRGKCVTCWELAHPRKVVEGREDLGIIGNYF